MIACRQIYLDRLKRLPKRCRRPRIRIARILNTEESEKILRVVMKVLVDGHYEAVGEAFVKFESGDVEAVGNS